MPDAAPGFRRLLMLQGPVGPFFWLLARRLRRLINVDYVLTSVKGEAGPGFHG